MQNAHLQLENTNSKLENEQLQNSWNDGICMSQLNIKNKNTR